MATFAGTTQKCKACDKKVYLVDQLTADDKVYHKSCFRCHHCKGTLKLSNFNSFEGVLYCKPHFDQLFKMTGSLEKSFEGIPRTTRVERSTDQVQTNSKVSSLFAGTQDKCVACNKKVYPIEKVAVDGKSYHKPCFRCAHGGCVISPSNYVAHEHRLYCRHHHTQLFMQKGNFSQLDNHENGKGNFSQPDNHESGKVNFSQPDNHENGKGNFSQLDNHENGQGNFSQPDNHESGKVNFSQLDNHENGKGNFSQLDNHENGKGVTENTLTE